MNFRIKGLIVSIPASSSERIRQYMLSLGIGSQQVGDRLEYSFGDEEEVFYAKVFLQSERFKEQHE